MQIIMLTDHFFLSVESFWWLRVITSGCFVSCGLLVVVFFGERCGCVPTLSKLKLDGVAIAYLISV